MSIRDARKAEAEKHLGLVRGIFASETAKAVEAAVLYEDGEGRDLEVPAARYEQTATSVAFESQAKAAVRAKGKVGILDMASYRYAGGSYANGGWSPEEQLCSESNLYPVLEGLQELYYADNRNSMRGELYSDRSLYVPGVMFLTDGKMLARDVIVCAAPNRYRAIENHRSEAECDMDLANRCKNIMHIAAANEVDTLILGAFGCGYLGNDPATVAGHFKEWIDAHPGVFESVVFAIPGGPALDVFRDVFASADAEPKVVETVSEDTEDDDEEEWLPPTNEDGRWVF